MLLEDVSLLGWVSLFVGCAVLLTLLVSAFVSSRENEPVATARLLAGSVVIPLPFFLAGIASVSYGDVLATFCVAVTAVVLLAVVLPIRGAASAGNDIPSARIDERDIMFSRAALVPGSPRFDEYYELRPENRSADDKFRAQPGLLAKGASAYDPFQFAAADASFSTIERLRPFVDGEIGDIHVDVDPVTMTEFLKRWGQKLGAVDVGATVLRDYHLYSHVGRGDDYGQLVNLSHKYAIALTVEMDKRAVDSAPLGPVVMESAQQYVASGTIAVQMATFIRKFGYPARAHIDGNYRVVCPLVARDAGLGEIGRMGLLMTPRLGPRVRLAVVTTDMPIVPDRHTPDSTVIDFCEQCKKCAVVCPSGAISDGTRKSIEGAVRWQIDSEACFNLWCQLGTDCARCVKACPYSHPDNWLHNAVRRGVRNSALFRKFAVGMDDLLYGKNPKLSEVPEWLRIDDHTA